MAAEITEMGVTTVQILTEWNIPNYSEEQQLPTVKVRHLKRFCERLSRTKLATLFVTNKL